MQVIALFLLLGFVLMIVKVIKEGNEIDKYYNEVINQRVVGGYRSFKTGTDSIIVDNFGNRVIFVIDKNGWISRGYESIYAVELVEDDVVVQRKSLPSVAGRAIIGGVLAGGVGAIIGGVTGKSNAKRKLHQIKLILSNTTTDIPYSVVTFLDSPSGVDTNLSEYITPKNNALYWCKLISAYIENPK